MARIIPDGWRELAVTGAAQREIETLAILADLKTLSRAVIGELTASGTSRISVRP